jgi:hypothetical protein
MVSIYLKNSALRRELQGGFPCKGHLRKCFLAFSHPDIQSLQQLWSKWVWLLTELAADLDVIYMMLAIQGRKSKGFGVTEGSQEISKESQGGHTICIKVSISMGSM